MGNMQKLRDELAEKFASDPQKVYLAKAALDSVEAGLKHLGGMGLRFDLVEYDPATAPAPQEFPKMFYRDGSPPLVVH